MTPEQELRELAKKQRKLDRKKAEARKRAAQRDRKAIDAYNAGTAHLHNLQYTAWHELSEESRNRYRRQHGIEEVPT